MAPLHRSFGFADLAPDLIAQRIDHTVVVQTVCTPDETPELLALAAGEPRIAGVVGWVDLIVSDVGDRLTALRALPGGNRLVGIRHQVQDEPDPDWLGRADVRRGLAAVAAAGLAYDVVVVSRQLPAVLAAVRAVPQLRFVLDHAGKPRIAAGELGPWREMMAALAAEPNLAVKLSGLVTEADPTAWTVDTLRPYADALLTEFGPGRVLFGSDWPVCLLAASYGEVVAATATLTEQLTPDERAQVFGGAAERWYRLPR